MDDSNAPGKQITTGFAFIIGLFIVIFTVEAIFKTARDAGSRFMTLVDYTANADDMPITIYQDPTKYKDAKTIGLSVNERTGIEFGYSLYLFVLPTTFTNTEKFKHVFHKGYAAPWPLMGPGVFIRGNENTMRVVMNTYKTPYTYVDIRNIPIQKWFHVVINCYKGGLDVFINGNLANRVKFEGTLPYQNFQDIYLFSNARPSYRGGTAGALAALGGENFELDGSFKGYISNMKYARYALSINEIQSLLTAGPSAKMKERTMETPPYLADDWWSNQA